MIVENVRGAQPWVGKHDIPLEEWLKLSDAGKTKLGRSACNFGSFHLWGDVPALMPINSKRGSKVPGFRFDGSGGSFQTASVEHTGVKCGGSSGDDWFAHHNRDSFLEKAGIVQYGQKVPAYSDPTGATAERAFISPAHMRTPKG